MVKWSGSTAAFTKSSSTFMPKMRALLVGWASRNSRSSLPYSVPMLATSTLKSTAAMSMRKSPSKLLCVTAGAMVSMRG